MANPPCRGACGHCILPSPARGEFRVGSRRETASEHFCHGLRTIMELFDQIQEAKRLVQTSWNGRPRVGIILGTGLGGLAEEINDAVKIPYGDIPHFPVSTVESHAGRLVCGLLAGVPVMAMEGRFHFYEGYT